MSVQQELDRRAEKLDKKLQRILYMFLLRQISILMAKTLGAEAVDEAYAEFMAWFKREYGTPENYNETSNRIMKVLFNLKRDFNNVIDKKGEEEKQTERMLRLRVYLISIGLIFSLHRESVITLALTIKAPYLKWVTAQDSRVCEKCLALEGKLYRPDDPNLPGRQHPNCRCVWVIVF